MKTLPGMLFTLILLLVVVVPQGSPVISNKYMTFYIPEYARRFIYLEGKYSFSIQLVLHKGDPVLTHPFNETSFPSSDPVEFIIKAPEYSYYGMMAIIQSLHFRENQYLSGCRDYIQFSSEEGKGFPVSNSEKICGKLPRGSKYEENIETLRGGQRTFFSPRGQIKLKVHVDPAVNRDDLMELNTIGAEIVFTAYTTCPGSDVGLKTLRPCSKNEETSKGLVCIPAPLFCDWKVDCGLDGEFGLDEENCYFPYFYAGAGILIILLIVLVICGFIHWIRVKTRDWKGRSESGPTDASGTDAAMCAVESVDMAF